MQCSFNRELVFFREPICDLAAINTEVTGTSGLQKAGSDPRLESWKGYEIRKKTQFQSLFQSIVVMYAQNVKPPYGTSSKPSYSVVFPEKGGSAVSRLLITGARALRNKAHTDTSTPRAFERGHWPMPGLFTAPLVKHHVLPATSFSRRELTVWVSVH